MRNKFPTQHTISQVILHRYVHIHIYIMQAHYKYQSIINQIQLRLSAHQNLIQTKYSRIICIFGPFGINLFIGY